MFVVNFIHLKGYNYKIQSYLIVVGISLVTTYVQSM